MLDLVEVRWLMGPLRLSECNAVLSGVVILGEKELQPFPFVDGSGNLWLREDGGSWYRAPHVPHAVAEYKNMASIAWGMALDEVLYVAGVHAF